jgi:hypothetical protein
MTDVLYVCAMSLAFLVATCGAFLVIHGWRL